MPTQIIALECFHARRVTIHRAPSFRGLAAQICFLEKRESSTDNEFITFEVRLWVLATLLKTSIAGTHISCYRFSLLAENRSSVRRCFCSSQTLRCYYRSGLPRRSTHNQDDGFTPPVRWFCCIRNLSTAIYTWDDKFGVVLACFVHFAIGMLWE